MDDEARTRVKEMVSLWPREVVERYGSLSVIGMGGMGLVFKAEDRHLNRPVAIKAIRAGLGKERDEVRARFRREIDALKALKHPNIVGLYDAFRWQGGELMIMEWVDGRELSIPLPEDWTRKDALRFLAEILDGLIHAHERGFIHRDLKPQNVLVDGDGHAKILDVGLVRSLDDAERTALTRTGCIVGTPIWFAPELLSGAKATAASDLYQTALIGQAMLAGRLHVGKDESGDFMSGALQLRMAMGNALPADLEGGLRSLFLRCLALDPGERPSLVEFREGLLRFIDPSRGATVEATVDEEPSSERHGPASAALEALETTSPSVGTSGTEGARWGRLLFGIAGALVLLFGGLALRALLSDGPLIVSSLKVEAAVREARVRWFTSSPRRCDWTLHLKGHDEILKRGRESSAGTSHELRLRALTAGRDYELRIFADGAEGGVFPFRTEAVSWRRMPRLSLLGRTVLLEWEGRGLGDVHWTLVQEGTKEEYAGTGGETGCILREMKVAADPRRPIRWTLRVEGGRSFEGRCRGERRIVMPSPSAEGKDPSSVAALQPSEVLQVGKVLLWSDGRGRLLSIRWERCFEEAAEIRPDWSSEAPGDEACSGKGFGAPLLVGEKEILVFREGEEKEGGLHRYAVEEDGRLRLLWHLPVATPPSQRTLRSWIHEGRFLRLAASNRGEETLVVQVFDPVARRLLGSTERSLASVLAATPRYRRLDEDRHWRPQGHPTLVNPPASFGGDAWGVLTFDTLGPTMGYENLRKLNVPFRLSVDDSGGRLEPLIAVSSLSPPQGAAVVGGSLWITAGKDLLLFREKEAPRSLQVDALVLRRRRKVFASSFYGKVFAVEGTPWCWMLDRPEDMASKDHIFQTSDRFGWCLVRLEEKEGRWMIRGWNCADRISLKPEPMQARLGQSFEGGRAFCASAGHFLRWEATTGRFAVARHPFLAFVSSRLVDGEGDSLVALNGKEGLRLRGGAFFGDWKTAGKEFVLPLVDGTLRIPSTGE